MLWASFRIFALRFGSFVTQRWLPNLKDPSSGMQKLDWESRFIKSVIFCNGGSLLCATFILSIKVGWTLRFASCAFVTWNHTYILIFLKSSKMCFSVNNATKFPADFLHTNSASKFLEQKPPLLTPSHVWDNFTHKASTPWRHMPLPSHVA